MPPWSWLRQATGGVPLPRSGRRGRREAGALTADKRANALWKQLLAEFEPPPIDPAIDEALKNFVERRKREGGALAA